MVEYGLIVAVISLMALSAVTLVGDSTADTFTTVAAELDGQSSNPGSSGNESDSDGSEQDSDAGDSDSSSDSNQDDEQSSDDEQGSDDEQSSDDESLDQQSEDDAESVDDEQNVENDEGSDDTGDDSQDEEDESPSNPVGSDSEFYWWNSTKHGGNGAWTASVTYTNDTDRHQYLDLEITRVDEKGKETVSQYPDFYVPANGSETYTHWSNSLSKHKGKLKGTVEVMVEVKSIKTSDENWQPYTYEVDEQPVNVEAPETP